MPTYNFKEQFVPFVQDMSKRQTVRAYRKDGKLPMPGEPLHLFTGMRTNYCLRLLPPLLVVETSATIFIYVGEMYLCDLLTKVEAEYLLYHPIELNLNKDVDCFPKKEKDIFAWQDGFRPDKSTIEAPGKSFDLMMDFWKQSHDFPFTGTVTYW